MFADGTGLRRRQNRPQYRFPALNDEVENFPGSVVRCTDDLLRYSGSRINARMAGDVGEFVGSRQRAMSMPIAPGDIGVAPSARCHRITTSDRSSSVPRLLLQHAVASSTLVGAPVSSGERQSGPAWALRRAVGGAVAQAVQARRSPHLRVAAVQQVGWSFEKTVDDACAFCALATPAGQLKNTDRPAANAFQFFAARCR